MVFLALGAEALCVEDQRARACFSVLALNASGMGGETHDQPRISPSPRVLHRGCAKVGNHHLDRNHAFAMK